MDKTEIIDGIDISDYPEHLKEIARRKFLPKKKGQYLTTEAGKNMMAGMLTPFNDNKQLYNANIWESIICHTSLSVRNSYEASNHLKRCKAQYSSRIKQQRRPTDFDNDRFQIKLELDRLASECEKSKSLSEFRQKVSSYEILEFKLIRKISQRVESEISNQASNLSLYKGINFIQDDTKIQNYEY